MRNLRQLARLCWASVAVGGAALFAADPLLPQIPPVPPQPLPPMATAKQEPKAKEGDKKNADAEKERAEREKKEKEKDKDEKKEPAWKPWQPPGRAMALAECLRIAEVWHPSVKAAQLSLAASERGYLALLNIDRRLEWFSPDLPFRRQQARRGIAIAAAEVRNAIQLRAHDVSRMYFEYVRATQLEETAASIIDQMDIFAQIARNLVEAGPPPEGSKLNRFTVAALESAIDLVRQQRDLAGKGRKQAVAALAEAIGLGPEDPAFPADAKLPVMGGHVSQEQVVAFALDARPELVQAAGLLDVTRLEVCAQAAVKHRHSVPTFASGSDLHSRILPPPIRNGEYRPGPVPPEMPANLVGKREDRVERARLLSERQTEVYNEVVNLVRLDATNAYLEWKSSADRLVIAEKRFERGKRLATESRKAADTKNDPELYVRNEALAGEAQAAYIEAVAAHLKALISLERATAGQVRAGFPSR